MIKAKTVALVGGIAFFFLAVFIQGILPARFKESRAKQATALVRSETGSLAEMQKDTPPYTEIESLGRRVYMREGCWYCHSQYVRPVAGEEARWGPLSEAGEYAYDQPHLLGTRRIGPDLSRVGGKYGDDWHYAHYYNPRMVVPDSIMPSFPWLFDGLDENGSPRPTEELRGLLAYVQRLGAARGRWRDVYVYQNLDTGSSIPATTGTVAEGRGVYLRRCVGCHGEKGDGNGPAAKFFRVKPRDFTAGSYKFRSTPSGSLPTDGDIFKTISAGIRGTAMPSWYSLPERDRWAVVHYIKTFSERFREEAPEAAMYIAAAPAADEKLLADGAEVYKLAKCWECHGTTGKGDGPSADTLTDDWDRTVRPTDFTLGIFKTGGNPQAIFRTMSTGLNGTPMPSYLDSLSEEQRWRISYYVLSFSADRK